MDLSAGWGDVGLEPGGADTAELGTLRLHLERTHAEVRLRVGRVGDDPDAARDGWTRWTVPPESAIHLLPAVPDRLVVVSHEQPFNLSPRDDARVYVRIPLNVQVVARDSRGRGAVVLADVPSLVLSDTWWGSFTDGELAYWLPTRARAEIDEGLFEPHLAMCSFHLTNDSDEALPIERFAVRVPHLTLFASGGRIWTSDVSVRYEAAAEGSDVRFGEGPPTEAPTSPLIAPPRQPPPRGFRALTFGTLRSLPSFGF